MIEKVFDLLLASQRDYVKTVEKELAKFVANLNKEVMDQLKDSDFLDDLVQLRVKEYFDKQIKPIDEKNEKFFNEHKAEHKRDGIRGQEHHDMLVGTLNKFFDITGQPPVVNNG